MSVEAFLRQGFIPFSDALAREVDVLGSVAPRLMVAAERAARELGSPASVTLAGIGASHAALAAPAAFLNAHGIATTRMNAGEAAIAPVADAFVALSQSGRSRETVALMRNVRGRKLAVVNVTDSPMAQAADTVLSLGDVPDSLASTIGYTASVMAMSMLAEALVHGVPSPSWLSIAARLGTFAEGNAAAVAAFGDRLSAATSADFVAPHASLGIAEGGSLLIREVARRPIAPFEARQYLHGLMESTSETTLHILVEGPDNEAIVRALAPLGREIVEFRSEPLPAGQGGRTAIVAEAASPLELPLFVALFLQHAVLRSARERVIDPDEFLFLDTGTKLGDGE